MLGKRNHPHSLTNLGANIARFILSTWESSVQTNMMQFSFRQLLQCARKLFTRREDALYTVYSGLQFYRYTLRRPRQCRLREGHADKLLQKALTTVTRLFHRKRLPKFVRILVSPILRAKGYCVDPGSFDRK